MRGNRRITFLSPCVTHILHHTGRSPLLPDSSSAPDTIKLQTLLPLLESPKDSLEMPQRCTVTVGNRAWICHLPVGGHRGHRAGGSSGWPVISPLLTEPLRLQDIQRGKCVPTSLDDVEGELQKLESNWVAGSQTVNQKQPGNIVFPT